MSTEPPYPYSVLCTLTDADGEALKEAAKRRGMSVRALLREYVSRGLQGDTRHGHAGGTLFAVPLTLAAPIAASLQIVGERKHRGAVDLVRDYVTVGIARDLMEMGDIPAGELTRTWIDDEGDPKK